ncbi:MAG: hypothetical protein IJW73_05830 [Candidatus Gastranaerophilales bacterium]|nr:hypothetical protein [Candidatus Gastranaerophilales bacterium]
MNLASINSYNTSFSANYKKGGKYSRPTAYSRGGAHAANTYKKSHKTALKTGVAATILTAGTLAAIFIPKGNDNKGAMAETTQPTYSYTETYNQEETTQPTIESQITYNRPINNSTMSVTTTPIEQREPKWHTVVTGDRLADIVKEYAKIDSSTPDHELSPYYVILLRDNSNLVASNKIENFDNMSDAEVISKLNNGEISVNNIHRGASYRVDGILPEYRKDAYIGNATQTEETPNIDPTEPTEVQRETSPEDTVEINGATYVFDKGTMYQDSKNKYIGKMYGNYAEVERKLFSGKVTTTVHTGSSADSEVAAVKVRDKYGKIETVTEYQNGNADEVHHYSYQQNTYTVQSVDLTTDRNQISVCETVYSNKDDSVISRTFSGKKENVVAFDFRAGKLTIGKEGRELTFNEGTLTCDDTQIGSDRYTGMIGNMVVKVDVLKNGACIEFYDEYGEISSREQYNVKGELIAIE